MTVPIFIQQTDTLKPAEFMHVEHPQQGISAVAGRFANDPTLRDICEDIYRQRDADRSPGVPIPSLPRPALILVHMAISSATAFLQIEKDSQLAGDVRCNRL